jgi:signal transduction histidine kinase
VTGLLDDLETDREQRKELLTIIDEECDRIKQLVSETSEIAQLESGEMRLDLSYSQVWATLPKQTLIVPSWPLQRYR